MLMALIAKCCFLSNWDTAMKVSLHYDKIQWTVDPFFCVTFIAYGNMPDYNCNYMWSRGNHVIIVCMHGYRYFMENFVSKLCSEMQTAFSRQLLTIYSTQLNYISSTIHTISLGTCYEAYRPVKAGSLNLHYHINDLYI